ncbi:hypothetical protein [Rossellomorea sp. RS05]|uniref:hypothetical protein n=1 Tax=Rossellomorea sp. RS05 TaxID=3149166 RepID=UPI0032218494
MILVLSLLLGALSYYSVISFLEVKEDIVRKPALVQLNILMVIPIVAIAILSFVVYHLHTHLEDRISHALLVLSLWLLCTTALFIIRNAGNRRLSVIILALISMVAAIAMTPIDFYNTVFEGPHYGLPLGISIFFIILVYINWFRMARSITATT